MGDIARIERVGGHPAIDFVNTLGGLAKRPDDEYLATYADLLTWAEGSQLLQPRRARALRHASQQRPDRAAEVLDRARHLRASLDAVLRSQLIGQQARGRDLDTLHEAYTAALAHAVLRRTDENAPYDWTWPAGGRQDALDYPLWPLAAQAVELLRSTPLERLTACGHCRWLFLDTSRNRSRRWCSMNACGAVIKMRRYRSAKRLQPARPG
jgi:predicted RNA-binding Zn ribbon-like protein